jgi:hypothetical protein
METSILELPFKDMLKTPLPRTTIITTSPSGPEGTVPLRIRKPAEFGANGISILGRKVRRSARRTPIWIKSHGVHLMDTVSNPIHNFVENPHPIYPLTSPTHPTVFTILRLIESDYANGIITTVATSPLDNGSVNRNLKIAVHRPNKNFLIRALEVLFDITQTTQRLR